ncbi:MAG: hypothetical protein KDK33_19430, partial [Leptospiraceae bacterium]|nr:hypothetical protein [Leptospiraceae bacterium]
MHDSDAGLGWAGPALTLNGRKFTGILIRGDEQSYTKSEYRDGMKEGTEEIVQSGIVIARGEYSDGRKDGLHLGWFMNGSRRFRYNYKHGLLDGEFWEWHPNGNLATFGRIHIGEL